MQKSTIYFVSRNIHKQEETRAILAPLGIEVLPDITEINELQTMDTNALVRDKAHKAFKKIGRPLIVEHTGLYLDMLGGFPGGLTQIFWDSLQRERFARLFASDVEKAVAKTYVGYVDGRRIKVFTGEVSGRIVNPRGDSEFQWDCVFMPESCNHTFAEMGAAKNEVSMRRLALQKLCAYLEKQA